MSEILRWLLSGRKLRYIGLLTMMWALALAAVLNTWTASFLIGAFELGLGLGLGNFEIGGDSK